MLKIWKQAWKKAGSLNRSEPVENAAEASGDDIGNGGSQALRGADLADIPAEALSDIPAKHAAENGRKERARSIDVQSPASDMERPRKKRKTEDAPLEDGRSSRDSIDLAGLLESAASQNTIALFDSTQVKGTLYVDIISRCRTRARTGMGPKWPRSIALFVVDDDSSIEAYAAYLEGVGSDLQVGLYTTARHTSGNNKWLALHGKDVVVISANLLLESLVEGSLKMSLVHEILISDAERIAVVKALHPVLRVMNDFYRPMDITTRPILFAVVTCSPGRKSHIDLSRLGDVMEAQVLSVTDGEAPDIPPESTTRSADLVVVYDPPSDMTETPLYIRLRDMGCIPIGHFRAARRILYELGPCAADLMWWHSLEEIVAALASGSGDAAVRALIESWTFDMPIVNLKSPNFNVSPQFAKLVDILKSCEPYGSLFRGVIIVKRAAIATMMVKMIEALDDTLEFLRPVAIVSRSPLDIPEDKAEITQSFIAGTYNLLVATKHAIDLDIPRTSIVIRYNLYENPVVHIVPSVQEGGDEGHRVYMVERDNDMHKRILYQHAQLNAEVQDRSHVGNSSSRSKRPVHSRDPSCSHSPEPENRERRSILDPVTGRTIQLSDAAAALGRFLDEVPNKVPGSEPVFGLKEVGDDQLVCSVTFPEGFPVLNISGSPCLTAPQAKASACFHACSRLFDLGLLDYRCFPQAAEAGLQPFRNDVDDEAKENTPVHDNPSNAAGMRCYARKRPIFWSSSLAAPPGHLYPTVIRIDPLLGVDHAPVLLLTKLPLPHLSSFSIFSSGSAATVHFKRAAAIAVDETQLNILHGYTMRISRALVNKPIECSIESMPYFFAPLLSTWEDDVDPEAPWWKHPPVASHIPWNLAKLAAERFMTPLISEENPTLDDTMLEDAVIQDRWVEFTNRHYVVQVRHDLTPLSKAEDSARESAYDNFVEYCKARRKGFEGLKNYEQPLIEVLPVPNVASHLDPHNKPQTPPSKVPAKYLIPELCVKFPIPASTFRTALLLPSILHKIDDMLIVKQLNAEFDFAINEKDLLAALSPPSAGVEFDYERLEFLGDAFLKYLSSVHSYVALPDKREGSLHVARQQIVSNRALHSGAIRTGLPHFIRSKPLVPKVWQPGLPPEDDGLADAKNARRENKVKREEDDSSGQLSLSATDGITQDDGSTPSSQQVPAKRGKRKRQEDELSVQWLGDKTVADVVESIIGAAYVSGGRELALKITRKLHVAIPDIDQWSDFSRKAAPVVTTIILPEGSIKAIEDIVGHKFQQPALLGQALTHASMQGHDLKMSYDRLEFLGDAILDFLTVRYVFNRHQQLPPGGLTMLKACMVSNQTLATISVLTGLYEHVQHSSSDLSISIRTYADNIRARHQEEYELAAKENRLPGQYWLEIEPPKAISDVIESIIGALYVSDGFSAVGVEKFFGNVLKPFYDRHIRLQTLSHHPNKTLFEYLQVEGCQNHGIVKEVDGPGIRCDVVVHDILLASAMDTSGNAAMRRASMSALDALEGDPDFMTRTCDCRAKYQGKKAQKKQQTAELGYDEDSMTVEDALLGEHTDMHQ